MAIFARQHVRNEHDVGFEYDQSLPRQRPGGAFPQDVKSSLGRGEMIAIDDARTIPRQPGFHAPSTGRKRPAQWATRAAETEGSVPLILL